MVPCFEQIITDLYEENPDATLMDIRHKINNLTLRDYLVATAKLVAAIDQEASTDLLTEISNAINDEQIKGVFARIIHQVNPNLNPEQVFLLNQHIMYLNTVTQITGPRVLMDGLISGYLSEELTLNQATGFFALFIQPSIETAHVWNRALEEFKKHGTKFNKLSQFIKSGNNYDSLNASTNGIEHNNPVEASLDLIGKHGDQSWSPLGQMKMNKRGDKLNQAATVIQKAYERHKVRNAPTL